MSTVCSAVSPAPVDQLPSTSTSTPWGASRSIQRPSAQRGRPSPTARDARARRRRMRRTSGGSATSATTNPTSRPRDRRRLGPRPPHHGVGSRRRSTADPSAGEEQAQACPCRSRDPRRAPGVAAAGAPNRSFALYVARTAGSRRPPSASSSKVAASVIPDLDRIACSHENSQALTTDMTRAAAREARARRVGPARQATRLRNEVARARRTPGRRAQGGDYRRVGA